ncbi:MAG: hypothetical protein WC401_11025, partial [Bacteroidales bacterium]
CQVIKIYVCVCAKFNVVFLVGLCFRKTPLLILLRVVYFSFFISVFMQQKFHCRFFQLAPTKLTFW